MLTSIWWARMVGRLCVLVCAAGLLLVEHDWTSLDAVSVARGDVGGTSVADGPQGKQFTPFGRKLRKQFTPFGRKLRQSNHGANDRSHTNKVAVKDLVAQVLAHVRLYHIVLVLQLLSMMVAGLTYAQWRSAGQDPNQKPDCFGIVDGQSQVNDLLSDLGVAFMLQVIWWQLAIASYVHLVVVACVNFFIVQRFVRNLHGTDREFWANHLSHGRNPIFLGVIVISLFGPKVLKVFGTKLLGMKVFSLEMDSYFENFVEFNMGVVFEGVVQIIINILVLSAKFGEMSQGERITAYVSAGYSVFNLLMALMEYSFADRETNTFTPLTGEPDESLQSLMAATTIKELKVEIRHARNADLPEKVIKVHEDRLHKLMKNEATDQLEAAFEKQGCFEEKEVGLEQARGSGVCSSTIQEFEELLTTQKTKCEAERLTAAFDKEGCFEEKQVALVQARGHGVAASTIQEFEEMLTTQKRRQEFQEVKFRMEREAEMEAERGTEREAQIAQSKARMDAIEVAAKKKFEQSVSESKKTAKNEYQAARTKEQAKRDKDHAECDAPGWAGGADFSWGGAAKGNIAGKNAYHAAMLERKANWDYTIIPDGVSVDVAMTRRAAQWLNEQMELAQAAMEKKIETAKTDEALRLKEALGALRTTSTTVADNKELSTGSAIKQES